MRLDDKIRARLPELGRLPLNVDRKAYTDRIVTQVKIQISRGNTIEDSIKIVTGSTAKPLPPVISRPAMVLMLITALIAGLSVGASYIQVQPKQVQALSTEHEEPIPPMKENETLLLVGADERPEIDKGSGTKDDIPGVRTDIITVVYMPKDLQHISAVSIPRDTSAYRPPCQEYDAEKEEYTGEELPEAYGVKINSVYEVGGAECLTKTIEEMTGTKVTRYVQLGFESFEEVIESVGGITVEEEEALVDDILGEISPGGKTVLNGEQALDYVRARNVEGTSRSDFDRINRQQKFVTSLMNTMQSKDVYTDPGFLRTIVAKVVPNLIVDGLSTQDLLIMVNSIITVNKNKIYMKTLPITGETENGNLLYDDATIQEVFSNLDTPWLLDENPEAMFVHSGNKE